MGFRDSPENRQFGPGVHAGKPRCVGAAAERCVARIVQPHWAAFGLLWLMVGVAAGTLHAAPKPDEPDTAAAEQADHPPDKPEPSSAEELALRQQQIAGRFQHFEKVLLRMAELSEATDPRRAALLKKAAALSGERHVDVQFERLVELLRKDQVSRALENQTDLDRDLRALLELLLSENRAKRIAAEKARIRDYLKRLNRIIKQQKDVQARTESSADPKSLSGEQERLADQTGGLAKEIEEKEEGGKEKGEGRRGKGEEKGEGSGEGQGQAEGEGQGQPQDQEGNTTRKRLEVARQRMKEAEEKLQQARREGAVEKQEEAIRELELAKAELEEILRQLREEEIMRMLAMLEARFREMLQLQREVYEGTVRLDKVPKEQRTHNQEIEASRLSGKETQLVLKADKALLLLREDGTAVAFPEAVEQMRDDMQQVVYRLAQARVGQITQAIEEDIIAALEEMIEALKKAQKETEDQKQQRPPPPSAPQDPPLIDVLAEVRMIRALQMRVNRRTQRYSKLIEGEQAQEPELVEALRQLAEREARIHRVTRDLAAGRNK